MRVLVVTLVRTGQLYGRALQSILAQKWNGQLDFMFLCGGDDEADARDPATYHIARYTSINRKYEQARQTAVKLGYDALWEAESDMIFPPDALRKLTAVDADIVYGLYCLRWGNPRWNTFTEVHWPRGQSISENVDLAKRCWGQVVDTAGVGDGCCLIHRNVLESVTRWIDPAMIACCSDWTLAEDCQRLGFRMKADLSVVCGHMTVTPSPRILWPTIDNDRLCRVEFLE